MTYAARPAACGPGGPDFSASFEAFGVAVGAVQPPRSPALFRVKGRLVDDVPVDRLAARLVLWLNRPGREVNPTCVEMTNDGSAHLTTTKAGREAGFNVRRMR